MLLNLHPGAYPENVRDTLRQVSSHAAAISNVHGSAYDRLTAYLFWANSSASLLQNQLSTADINRLVLTPGYERLLYGAARMTGTDTGTQGAISSLVTLETGQRIEAIDQAVKELDDRIQYWAGDAVFVVADTTVYVEHEDKLRDLDFTPLRPGRQSPNTRLLVPIVVVDELDGLKRSSDKHTRWRAGYTLAVLDEVFRSQPPHVLRSEDRAGADVFLEIIYDPPGHQRLLINDDEIIDRTVSIKALANREVTLLTFDTGQTMRARNAGLEVRKLTKDIGQEPPPRNTPATSAGDGVQRQPAKG